jgi:hypothetical protein
MRSRPTLIALAVVMTACYRPSSSITAGPDGEVEPGLDATAEAVEDVPPEPTAEPPADGEGEPAADPVEEAEHDVWEESDPGWVPVTLAPDFELEDLNPNSPTHGSMRRLSDQRGKVIVFYIGNFG